MNSTTTQPAIDPVRNPAAAMRIAEPILLTLLRKRSREIRRSDRDDIAQTVRLKLWETIIPRFDARRGATFVTFVYASIRNAITDEVLRLKSIRRRGCEVLDDGDIAVDDSAATDSLIEQIIDQPHCYLTAARAELLTLVQSIISRTELADRLSITTGALDKRTARLCADLRALV